MSGLLDLTSMYFTQMAGLKKPGLSVWRECRFSDTCLLSRHMVVRSSRPYGTLRAGDIEGSDVEPTTLRADDFEGRRLWGQATLRAGDIEGKFFNFSRIMSKNANFPTLGPKGPQKPPNLHIIPNVGSINPIKYVLSPNRNPQNCISS